MNHSILENNNDILNNPFNSSLNKLNSNLFNIQNCVNQQHSNNSLSLESLDLILKQNLIDIRQNQIIIDNKGKQLREFQSERKKSKTKLLKKIKLNIENLLKDCRMKNE